MNDLNTYRIVDPKIERNPAIPCLLLEELFRHAQHKKPIKNLVLATASYRNSNGIFPVFITFEMLFLYLPWRL